MFEGKMPKRLPKGLEQAILSIQRLRGAQIIHKEFKRYFRGAQYRITMADRIGFYTIHCNLSIDANRKVAERVEFHHTNWRFLSEEIVNWDPYKTYAITTEMLGQFREVIKTKMEQFVEENVKAEQLEEKEVKAESLAKEFTEKLIGAMNEELYVRAKKAYSNIANANMATAKEAQDEMEQKGVNLLWNLI